MSKSTISTISTLQLLDSGCCCNNWHECYLHREKQNYSTNYVCDTCALPIARTKKAGQIEEHGHTAFCARYA